MSKPRSNSIRAASRARLASPDELVIEIEPTKRPAPDAIEPPAKFLTLPAELNSVAISAPPSTWQSASLETPPPASSRGRSVGMGLPDDPISPGPGAGVEEVRVWSQRNALRLEKHQELILKEFHAQQKQLNGLQAAAERHALLEQRIIVLENPPGPVQLEINRIEEEVKRQSTGVSSKVEAEFLQLRGELSDFAAKIEGAQVYIANVELQHQQHVQTAFTTAEAAITRLSGNVEMIRAHQHSSAAASSNGGGGASTVNFFDYQLVKDKVEKMEVIVTQILSKLDTIPDCHCVHVESLKVEVERINVQLTQLGGAGNAETRSLHSRLSDVEAALNKAATGKGLDPWQPAFSPAPIRMPPGSGMPG